MSFTCKYCYGSYASQGGLTHHTNCCPEKRTYDILEAVKLSKKKEKPAVNYTVNITNNHNIVNNTNIYNIINYTCVLNQINYKDAYDYCKKEIQIYLSDKYPRTANEAISCYKELLQQMEQKCPETKEVAENMKNSSFDESAFDPSIRLDVERRLSEIIDITEETLENKLPPEEKEQFSIGSVRQIE